MERDDIEAAAAEWALSPMGRASLESARAIAAAAVYDIRSATLHAAASAAWIGAAAAERLRPRGDGEPSSPRLQPLPDRRP